MTHYKKGAGSVQRLDARTPWRGIPIVPFSSTNYMAYGSGYQNERTVGAAHGL